MKEPRAPAASSEHSSVPPKSSKKMGARSSGYMLATPHFLSRGKPCRRDGEGKGCLRTSRSDRIQPINLLGLRPGSLCDRQRGGRNSCWVLYVPMQFSPLHPRHSLVFPDLYQDCFFDGVTAAFLPFCGCLVLAQAFQPACLFPFVCLLSVCQIPYLTTRLVLSLGSSLSFQSGVLSPM